jgi:hypothetical protein
MSVPQQPAALQDFDPAYVADGSFAAEGADLVLLPTSAALRTRT